MTCLSDLNGNVREVNMRFVLVQLIRLYQKTLSLLIGGGCRFYPTCSSYSIEAIERYGSLKGSWLMICRISKCHPLNPGGLDPVPERAQNQNRKTRSGACNQPAHNHQHSN